MKLSQVKDILKAEVVVGEEFLDREVNSAFGSDLMSDVLAFVKDQALLLTGLVNGQVIRTAEMMDIKAIVFVRGKKPTEEIAELAKEYSMVIMSTDYTLYPSCGKLYCAGLVPKEVLD
ncbi:MAG: hypothetical protein E7392_02665 [Ruminococcaceae bacterium]|nr:hypothetical protein [Oscillospiraceae bacterium]